MQGVLSHIVPTRSLLIALCTAAVLTAAAPSGAIVPPKDCGTLKVKGKKYNVKADQMRCADAKKYTTNYLGKKHKPKGYSCQKYGSETQLAFRCEKGIKTFFAIKR